VHLLLALSLDPKEILNSLHPYGEIGLILIVFAETGLLVGFFLPGDSLLFTAGLLANQGRLNLAAIFGGCCARVTSGQPIARQPRRVNSRRLIGAFRCGQRALLARSTAFYLLFDHLVGAGEEGGSASIRNRADR